MAGTSGVEIYVGGKKVKYTPTSVDILKIKYYPDNPRVNNILTGYEKEPTQEDIQRELWRLESTKDLYQDIKLNGGLIEPILIKDSFVLEGNSRLCSYRKLYEDTKSDQWRYIPAIDLPSEVTDKQIFQLLGTYHVRGKAKWRTFEKASYVARMKNQFNTKEEDIANELGLTKAEVEQMILSYNAMIKHKVHNLEKFSYFMEFYKNKGLKKIVSEDPSMEKKFVDMVKNDHIPRAEDVRSLPAIFNNKKAKSSMEKENNFVTAKKIACKQNPENESAFLKQLKTMTERLKEAEIPTLKKELKDAPKRVIVQRFIKEVDRFRKNLKLE